MKDNGNNIIKPPFPDIVINLATGIIIAYFYVVITILNPKLGHIHEKRY